VDPLLFVSHRMPYPPNKGDKVRSYHFLKHLATRYRVFLGTFIDDPADWQHVDAVRKLCADVRVEPLAQRSKRVRSATGFLTGEALSLPYFRSTALQAWVDDIVRRERIARAFAYSSPMAQYILGRPGLRCIVDFVDMDSAKWTDYARRRPWPVSAVFSREGSRLLAWEQEVAARADATLFVTEEEADLFRNASPHNPGHIVAVRNGVDSDFFSPSHDLPSPFGADERAIVFTGAMDYWPNIDAVTWFAGEVLPKIRERDRKVRFYVVGMNPAPVVQALGKDAATVVTGRVEDVRPYLQNARVVVAPLRVARGIQNKILEAMAMAKPVVSTTAAAAALAGWPGSDFEVAADASEYAAKVCALLDAGRAEAMGRLARERVLHDYAWAASERTLDALLERAVGFASGRASGAAREARHAFPAN
jgi:sugar transferase (PEP-CTERM/EpsH1 system associated)